MLIFKRHLVFNHDGKHTDVFTPNPIVQKIVVLLITPPIMLLCSSLGKLNDYKRHVVFMPPNCGN